MNVLVTGATGFVGKRLCKKLYEQGHAITVLSRSGEKAKDAFPFPVKAFAWDASKENPPAEAFNGVEGVVHLAGEGIADKRWSESRKRAIHDSRSGGTQKLVKTISGLSKKPKVVVSASAIGWYGNRGNEELTETSSLGTGFLPEVCRDWEKPIDSLPSEIRTVKIRIGIVLGTEGGALKKLLPIFKLGAGGPIGKGDQWMSWIHVDDLVSLLAFSINEEKAKGVLNGVTPVPVTNADFSKALGAALHRPAFMPTPAFALKLALGEMSEIVLASQKVLPKATLATGFSYQFADITSAFADIVKKKVS